MLITAEEWIEKANDQYNQKRYTESLLSATKAIEIDDDIVNGWWFLALSHQELGDLDEALDALNKTIDRAPYFANGWARYGAVLQMLGADEDEKYSYHMSSQEAFEEAVELDKKHVPALTALSTIYSNCNSDDPGEIDKEIDVLARLDEVDGWLTSNQLNRMGILHFKKNNFFDAIKFWSRNIDSNPRRFNLFNLGMAYNHNEVSQDADAIDIWRLTLLRFPDYNKPKDSIEELLPRLLTLSQKALSTGETLLDPDQWYQYYINPFELINYSSESYNIEDVDVKKVQHLKKRLLAEIELEDGVVPWMEHVVIDRSKAIGICDDLHNKKRLEFHLHVFNNKPLLGFLSRGEHRHFTVDKEWSPLETIEFIEDRGNGFRDWLTNYFVKQFDLVISKAIDLQNIPVLEVLLDGRRWIDSAQQDLCFIAARKKIDQFLEPLRQAVVDSKNIKPSVGRLHSLLHHRSLMQMLNLFPTYFDDLQNESVDLVLDIAVASYNSHGDSELAKGIVELMDLLVFKSEKSNQRIKTNISSINEIIKKETLFSFKKTIKSNDFTINRNEVCYGDALIPLAAVEKVRWGNAITGHQASPVHEYMFCISGGNETILVVWSANAVKSIVSKGAKYLISKFSDVQSSDEELTVSNSDKMLQAISAAIMRFIVPVVAGKIIEKIKDKSVDIGGCSLSYKGVTYSTGFFGGSHFVNWKDVKMDVDNGELIVRDSINIKKKISFSLRNTDNAFVLYIIKDMING